MRLLGVIAAALVLAGVAQAAPSVRYGIQDDAWLQHGPGTLEERLDRLDGLGVELVRFNLSWDEVARRRPLVPRSPDDPAYAWGAPDSVLEGLREHGIAAVVAIVGTPRFANGGRSANWAPTSGRSFADFAYAAARRYRWVRDWLVWNEPNQRRWLRPTSPRVYTLTLLNPAYAAIHRANPRARVGGGVTAPRGATGGVSPIAWIAGMRAAGARLDAYAHHPYPSNPKVETPFGGGCDHCATATMATLERLLSAVGRAFGDKQVWLTEYGYQTYPPDFFLGVRPAVQAQYLAEAAYRVYAAPRVTMLIHYLVRDEPDLARFQSGLLTLSGKVKPAWYAYLAPLVEVGRRGAAVTLWGQVRPGRGVREYRLQQFRGDAWHWVGGVARTDRSGTLRRTVRAAVGSRLRLWVPEAHAFGAPVTVAAAPAAVT